MINKLINLIVILLLFYLSSTKILAQENNSWKPIYEPFDSITYIMEGLNERDPELHNLLDKLYKIADDVDIPILKYRCYYWEALIQRKQFNRIDSTIMQKLKTAVIYMDSSEYLFDYARIRFLMLNPTSTDQDYIKQYETYTEFLDLFKQSGDVKYQGNVNRWLGILMSELNEPAIALNYLETANKLYDSVGADILSNSNSINMSVIYNNLGQKDKAIETLENLIDNKNIKNDTILLIALYSNLSNLTEEAELRKKYSIKAYNLANKYGKNQYQYYLTKFNLGNEFYNSNNIDSALVIFEDVYQFASKNNISRLMIPSLQGLSNVYKAKEDWEKAYHYQRTFSNVSDSIRGMDKISEINKMESGLAIKEYQNKLIIEQQKNELNHKQNVIIVILSVSLIIIAFFITLSVWQKNRITATQLKNEALENENLQQEIDLRNRELSATSLILSEKNGILTNILTQIEKFRKNGEMSNPSENTLRKLINNNLQTENEWEAFKLHFEKVHPDFFTKLKSLHADLSENELKLCAYIRIGMTSKQISNMISVLPNTINTNRYLMRKKMNLDAKDSLDDYIRSI